MNAGMNHSLCFSSSESNTQPSESMPIKKSCLGVMENICDLQRVAFYWPCQRWSIVGHDDAVYDSVVSDSVADAGSQWTVKIGVGDASYKSRLWAAESPAGDCVSIRRQAVDPVIDLAQSGDEPWVYLRAELLGKLHRGQALR